MQFTVPWVRVCLCELLYPLCARSIKERTTKRPASSVELMAFRSHIRPKRRVNETKVTLHQVGRVRFSERSRNSRQCDPISASWFWEAVWMSRQPGGLITCTHALYLNLSRLIPVHLQHERVLKRITEWKQWGVTHMHSCKLVYNCLYTRMSLHTHTHTSCKQHCRRAKEVNHLASYSPSLHKGYLSTHSTSKLLLETIIFSLQPTPQRFLQTHKHQSFWCLAVKLIPTQK